jgi:uncharacterized membrane-anchored protein YhcB (DUF1043 family)
MIELCCSLTSPINWPEIVISAIIGAVIGYFISIWASEHYEERKHQRDLKALNDKFGRHAGLFENFYHQGNKIETKISDAKLEYLADKGNYFKITVTTYTDDNANKLGDEEIQIWQGEIRMVDNRFGDLSYIFITPERLTKDVGFKRIVFSSDLKSMILIGERPRYGDEWFDRKVN